MASKRIDVNINSTNAGTGFKSAGSDIAKMKSEAGSAGTSIGQSISKGTSTASSAIGKLGSVASSTFGTIKAGASAASQSIGDMGNAIASVAGGLGAMEVAQAMWTGATQKQFNSAYLQTKMSKQAADEYISTIQKIVAEVPGDDTFMNNLMTGAVAKQTNLTNAQLKQMGNLAADYLVTSQSMGKSQLETQMDLKEYILTGNTSQLERDSILKNQMNTLKGTKSVQERILALDKAMKAEGYAGLSQLDIASIKWEEIKGKLQLAATTIGEKILPAVEGVMNFFLKLDEATNGWSSMIVVAGGALALLGLAMAPIVTATASAYLAMKKYRQEAVLAAAANAANKGPGGAVGGAGGTISKIGGYLTNAITAAMGAIGLNAMAGGTWAASASSIAMGFATGIARAFTSVAGGILGPAIWGLFQDGSLLSGSWNPQESFNKQFGPGSKVANDFGNALNAGVKGSLADQLNLPGWLMGNVVPAFSAAGAYIKGAWGNTVAYMTGAWTNTVNSVMSGWNWLKSVISGGITGPIRVLTGAISSAFGTWNWLKRTVSAGATGAIRILTGAIQSAWSQVVGLYNYVRNGVTGVIRTVMGGGPSAARGPGIGLHYENYTGHRQNAWNAAGTGMSGNCVDMTLGLMSAYGGSMVSGTWNGGPHVWWQAPNGAQLDPARKALEGTWTPPAKGPGDGMYGNVIINGDVYGFDDFKRKVEQANSSIMYDAGRY